MNKINRLWLVPLILAGCAHEPAFSPSQGHIDSVQPAKAATVSGSIPKPVKNAAFLPPPKPKIKEQTYSVVVNDVPVREILFALARESKLNVDIHPGIMGNVTLNAVDQTLPAILERVSRQIDLRYKVEGSVLSVAPDMPTLRTYKINYVNMERDTTSSIGVAAQISATGSSSGATGTTATGSVSAAGNSSSATVTSKSKNNFWDLLADNIRTILKSTKTQAASVEERAAKAEAIRASQEERLKQVEAVSKAGAGAEKLFQEAFKSQPATFESKDEVIINPVAGTVTVMATERQHGFIQQYIDTVMSAAQRQVMIEATIVEVELNDGYKAGIDWQRLSRGGGLKGVTFQQSLIGGVLGQTFTGANTPLESPGSILSYSNSFVDIALKMLQSFGNTKVLSSPKMMVMNNQTSILKVVDNYVYFTVESQISQSTVSGANNLKSFTTTPHTIPIGVVMNVTPQINENGKVTLNVRPTITDTFGDPVVDPNPDVAGRSSIPQLRVREMESVMQIDSGETAVLGGLMQDKLSKSTDSVPGISRVPVLGKLFSSKADTVRKSELVIFLRPTVIERASIESDELKSFKQYLPDQLPVVSADEPAH